MTVTRPRVERGAFPPETEHYRRSLLGAPLIWFSALAADREDGLIPARTHDGEDSSVVTLSCALHTLNPSLHRHHVVLVVNSDGCQPGLRADMSGIDLSRNFPVTNWKMGETVYRWNSSTEGCDLVLLTGESPGSEPGTQALYRLIHQICLAWVVFFYSPLAYIEDSRSGELGSWLIQSLELPLVTGIGYKTPDSFGGWCADLNLHYMIAELPPISSDEASKKYLMVMSSLLCQHPRDGATRP